MSDSELKPCKCGGSPIFADRNDPFKRGGMRPNGPNWRTIACADCGLVLCEYDSPDRNPAKRREWLRYEWNRRANEKESGDE